MRVLVTCDRYPHSIAEGLVLRIYHYVRQLNGRHAFDLVCLDNQSPTNPEIESLFRRVERYPLYVRPERIGLERIRDAFDVRSLYPRSEEATHAIDRLVASENYDLLWDAACAMVLNLENARRRLPLLADQVDDSILALQRKFASTGTSYQKLWLGKQIALEKIFVRRYIATAEAVLFVSNVDAESFRRVCPSAETVVIPNGVDETYFSPATPPNGSPELAFEGSMAFGPNIDAVRFFVSDIFPLVRKEVPETRFTIVGRDPCPRVRALASDSVVVTGSVPDVRPYVHRAQVFVCPMRLGAGIKNKILQAWAMGKAVVATPEALGGLEYEDQRNVFVARDPQSFAEAVIALLRDPQRAAALGAEARATIERLYTWKAKALEFENLMERVVQKRRSIASTY